MSNFKKFKEQLPKKEKFYISLTSKNISDKEYENILQVWNESKMKGMKDYHDLYFKCDFLFVS